MNETTAAERASIGREQLEEKRRERAILQNQVQLAVANSFPAKLKQLMQGAKVPAPEGTTAGLQSDCAKHAKAVADLIGRIDRGIDQLSRALAAAADSGTYGDVCNAIEGVRFDKADLAQLAVKLWTDAEQLAGRVVAELKPLPDRLDAEAAAVVATVKQELTKIGSGIESMPAYAENAHTAERRFDYAARMNVRSRKAIAACDDARATHAAAVDVHNRCKVKLFEARDYLHKIVLRSIQS